jgi:hypothetical protein
VLRHLARRFFVEAAIQRWPGMPVSTQCPFRWL